MDFSLSSSLIGNSVSNPDKLALDLQFATDKTLTARKGPTPTFTRASSATFVGSNGLIQSAVSNAARFDHDPVTLACKGLLIEESRTNNCYNSNLLTSASWTLAGSTIALDALGPDGTTAFELSETAVTSGHSISNSGGATGTLAFNGVGGSTYTLSLFFKKSPGSIDWVQLTGTGSIFGAIQYANFNISTGVIGNYANVAAGTIPKIEQFQNGWYRCSITLTATATATGNALNCNFINNTNGTTRGPSYLGSTANKVLLAMGQVELGAFPTSYIPNVATTGAIRSADVCGITGATATSLLSSTGGSWGINFVSAGYGAGPYGNAAFLMSVAGDNGNRIGAYQNPNGVVSSEGFSSNITRFSLVNSSTVNTPHKLSFAYKVGETSSQFVDNSAPSAIATNLAFVMPAFTSLRIGSQQMTSADYINGTISSFRYFQKRLSNAKLQALTV